MIILWSSLVAGPHEFPFHNGLSPFLYGLCSFSIRWRHVRVRSSFNAVFYPKTLFSVYSRFKLLWGTRVSFNTLLGQERDIFIIISF